MEKEVVVVDSGTTCQRWTISVGNDTVGIVTKWKWLVRMELTESSQRLDVDGQVDDDCAHLHC